MKKIFITLSFSLVLILPLLGQNQVQNLEKYWKYRQELRDKFIVVSGNVEEPGVNIPAADIYYTTGKPKLPPHVSWGDGNSNMSHYLSMLATELWLLKNNNQDYSTTLKELYYAMLAMERLDLYSEKNFRTQENKGNSVNPSTDINGFHSRDDVSQVFWDKYKNHFPIGEFSSCYSRLDDEGDRKKGIYDISQDVTFHNMEGLALVAKLVGTENVGSIPVTFQTNYIPNYLTSKGIKSGNNVNFSLWAKDFIKRYIKLMQNSKTRFAIPTHWYLENPVTGNLVEDGNGDDGDMAMFYSRGVIHVGNAIVGEDLATYEGLFGKDYSKKVFKDLFEQHAIDLNDIRVQTFPVHIIPRDPISFAAFRIANGGQWLKVDGDFFIKKIILIPDFYRVHSLACVGNASGASTFNYLVNYMLTYNPHGVTYPNPNPTPNQRNNYYFPIYEHFPLMYVALYDPNYEVMGLNSPLYNELQPYYERLLNVAPLNGCRSNGHFEWSSSSRCVWPENLGKKSNENIQYSGLDYMMLHNLFYIAFHKCDYKTLYINQSSPTAYRQSNVSYGIIETSASILANNVTYTATNKISMKPGFSTAGKTNFSAKIQPRNNSYKGNLYKIVDFGNGGTLKSFEIPEDIDMEELKAIILDLVPVPAAEEGDELLLASIAGSENIVGLENAANEKTNIAIFPNPTKGVFRIQLSQGTINAVEIKDIQGITVFKEDNLSENETVVDFSAQPSGTYLVTITLPDKYARTFKIIKY